MKLKGKIVRVNQIPKEGSSDTEGQTITFQYFKKDSKEVEEFFDLYFWDTISNMTFEITPKNPKTVEGEKP